MRLSFYLSLLLLLASCNGSEKIKTVVSGKFSNAPTASVFLERIYPEGDPEIMDSVEMKDGQFELKATLDEESLLQLRFSAPGQSPIIYLITDSKKMKLKGDWKDFSQLRIEESPASERLRVFIDSIARTQQKLLTLNQRMSSKIDSVEKIKLEKDFAEAASRTKQYIRSVAEKDESPVLSLFALSVFSESSNVEELEVVMNGIQKRFPRHALIEKYIEGYRKETEKTKKAQGQTDNTKISVGATAPDLTMPDPSGKPVSIKDFRGKYVLVDFWASWCGPCRAENPNVVEAFEKYKSKNFTILGVSLDKDKQSWIDAIQNDKLNWSHMSDLKFWDSEAGPVFGVESIPFNVLLDPEGKIIAIGLRGGTLHQKLEEVLK